MRIRVEVSRHSIREKGFRAMGFSDSSALQAWRTNLSTFSPLEREAERELARKFAAGDNRSGERLVEACLPFVMAIAMEYRRWGVPMEDVVQQGNLGLLRAARKFDLTKDCRLATYAAYWIRAEIREYVVRSYRVVRLGTTKGERRALRAYRTTREADPEKLAEMSGLSPERVRQLLPVIAGREQSLDHAPGDLAPPIEMLRATGPSPEEEADDNERQHHAEDAVAAALKSLSDRERLIVKERLMNDEPLTLQQLGDLLGVSKERVRQLEERACGKLRTKLAVYGKPALLRAS